MKKLKLSVETSQVQDVALHPGNRQFSLKLTNALLMGCKLKRTQTYFELAACLLIDPGT